MLGISVLWVAPYLLIQKNFKSSGPSVETLKAGAVCVLYMNVNGVHFTIVYLWRHKSFSDLDQQVILQCQCVKWEGQEMRR